MKKGDKYLKELLLYGGILAILISIIVCNNLIWKLGKQQNTYNFENNITYFESDNIIYNVLYEEEWLD